MAIQLKGKSGKNYLFEGPFYSISSLDDKPGIYAIICDDNFKHAIFSIGESKNINERVKDQISSGRMVKKCKGSIKYAQYLTKKLQKAARKKIEKDIKNYYDFKSR